MAAAPVAKPKPAPAAKPAPAPKPARPATADDFSEDAETQIDPKILVATPPSTPLPPVAATVALAPAAAPTPTPSPPPTRIGPLAAESYKPPSVHPVPEVPEGGLVPAAKYALQFMRARWQRRGVIRQLGAEIRAETSELDGVLGTLGRQARELKIENRVFAAENAAIDAAEARRAQFDIELGELTSRVGEENARFGEVEAERSAKMSEADAAFGNAQREHAGLEAQRRSLREKRKMVERTQKGYLQAADQRDEQAGRSAMGDARAGLRRAAEELRRDAAGMDPERQDLDRRLSALERPISQAAAQVEALRAELDSARRSLNDAREGHRHRIAEIEAEQGRKSRERTLADAEIQRRLVTLGTLVNLHRVDAPEFADLYDRIDQLRSAIGSRSAEIDRLTAEREAYDKRSLTRGFLTLGGALVLLITLIAILLAII